MRFVAIVCGVALLATAAAAKPPSWDRKSDSPKRFRVLKAFDGAAVLDQETGLVWAQASAGSDNWYGATQTCDLASIGGRMGWRLARIDELYSLIDPATGVLPEGNPFTVPDESIFWSATTSVGDASQAKTMDNQTNGGVFIVPKNSSAIAWCVRGGTGVDGM
jgi:Protein of unknown function (DUF1566)